MFLPRLIPIKGVGIAALALMGLAMTSCDSSFVFEDLRPCVPDYRVKLSYVHNMGFEERVSQVEAAEVYAFDKEGKLAAVATADRQKLIDNNWTLPIDLERFENYDLVIWGGLVADSPFSLDGSRAVTSKDDLTCRLATTTHYTGLENSDKHFPGLFHGVSNVTYDVEDGIQEHKVELIKNTNDIHVLIQKETGAPMEDDYYDVEITDANGVMDHTNAVSGNKILYNHHNFTIGDFKVPDGNGGEENTYVSSGKWDFSVARLMEGSDAKLQIRLDASNIVLVEENLVDLLLHAKRDPKMPDQEFLDRQDTYYITYRLRVEEDWLHISVYVNNWLVIKNDIEWK